jgi:hypothetical protein
VRMRAWILAGGYGFTKLLSKRILPVAIYTWHRVCKCDGPDTSTIITDRIGLYCYMWALIRLCPCAGRLSGVLDPIKMRPCYCNGLNLPDMWACLFQIHLLQSISSIRWWPFPQAVECTPYDILDTVLVSQDNSTS